MIATFTKIPAFETAETPIREFVRAAKVKAETLRTDPEIFEIWPLLVTASERLANFTPRPQQHPHPHPALVGASSRRRHSMSDGLQLIRNGRDLVFYIARARTSMPKSTREYIERCNTYLTTGRAPVMPAPLPA